jgi:signal transduction histidine kinase
VTAANDEISQLSNTLNQMLERIDKAFASVRAFTGNASHELRTPIALLRTEIEVALNKPRTPAEYRETLSSLHQESIRMGYLVENLLALARADGGAEAFSLIPVDVPSLLQKVHKNWRKAMHMAMVDFRIEAEDRSLTMLGDASSIARLLSILLENASKYTPPGGSVVMSAVAFERQVLLSVRDTGIGISDTDLPRIFDRFYRSASAGNVSSRGSGLGLALAKWIAERHGTKLTVESIPGRGSCFSFALERVANVASVHVKNAPVAK